METITIPKEEYEKLKKQAIKMKIVQKSFEFLSDKREDIYTPDDLK